MKKMTLGSGEGVKSLYEAVSEEDKFLDSLMAKYDAAREKRIEEFPKWMEEVYART
jgi:hypothetical protein